MNVGRKHSVSHQHSKRGWARLVSLGALLFGILMLGGQAFAVHDLDLFELDRNAEAGVAPGDDWSTLNAGGGSAKEFTGILPDIGADGGTQFQGGGSKDDLDITQWLWKLGEPLDKDDITNAYAAAYVNTKDTGANNIGDLIIYYGLDRFSANGSAQVGFWFLQDPNFGLTNTPSGGGFKFSGVHTNNDILVQSNFSQGGVIDRITVYKWLNGALVQVGSAADCLAPSPADDPACGTVNRSPQTAPWPYTPKANEGSPGTFLTGAFFEGGINITRLVPDAGCFTGFLAETRTSTPFDARLKDFVTGGFDLCSIAVTKTGDTLSKVGDPVDYTVTIQNTGALTLYKDDITDTLLGNITINGVDQVNSFVQGTSCGASLAPGASCTITLKRTVQAGDPDPLPNTVNIVYRGKADLSGSAVSSSDDHSVNLFQPSITVDKTGDTLSKVGDDVTYTIKVCNTSSADSPNLVKDSVTDSLISGVNADFGASLAPGACESHEFTRTVLAGDPDPLVNTATAHYHPDGFPNDITASDSHSVNLFQPSITIDKECTDLSKIGDPVNCTVGVTNTSSNDTPDLVIESISDTVQGDLTDAANVDTSDCGATLASGASCTITYSFNVPQGASDPFTNTVTVQSHPTGFTNDIDDTDSDSVNLFQPSITIDKECTDLSKIGDPVNCTVGVTNTSSNDTPDLVIESISDTVQGDLTDAANVDTSDCGATLASGASCTITYSFNVPQGASDPFTNTVTVQSHPTGFTNDIDDTDSDSVNLFQPSITIDKECTDLSKIGDPVNCTVGVTNTSSNDTPDLVIESISDTVQGDLTDAANVDTSDCGATLASGASCTITYSFNVPQGASDPFTNTVTVQSHPTGFTNDIDDTDSDSVNLFQPSITIDKECTDLSKIGDPVNCTVGVTNTSSNDTPDLVIESISDTVQGDLTDAANVDTSDCGATLASGASCTITYSFNVPQGASDPFTNTVTVQSHPTGFANDIDDTDSDSVNLFQPSITIDKECTDLSKIGDPVNCTVGVTNTSSNDTPDLVIESISDTVQGDLTDAANVDTSDCGATLASGASCTITYSFNVPQGASDPFTNTVTVQSHPTGFANDIDDTDSDSVNLFQPSITIDKECTDLSKIGDPVNCTVGVTNTSSNDTPDLVIESISDTVQGDLTDAANVDTSDCGATLASGASCTITYSFNVPQGASDPFTNTVTVQSHPTGFTNDIDDTDSDSVNLFQPSITIDKECTDLSKIGDPVNCTVGVTNTSSNDTPDLVIESISDTVQGDLTDAANVDTSDCGATLASGASCTITYSFNVPQGASDPFTNTVTVQSHPTGFTNDIDDTDSDSVDLFQPSVTIDKSGTELSKEGDAITYNFTITNTSSAGSPNLVLDSVTDVGNGWAGLGDLTANATAVGCGTLAPGASCTFSVTIVAPAGPDPLKNTVTTHYHPDGFPNDITASDDHSVNLFQPSIDVTKTCAPSQVKVGETITFTCTITNTSTTDSPDLILVSVTDVRDPGGVSTDLTATAAAAGCDVLTSSPSETCSFSYTFTPSATGTVTNTVTAHYNPDGFTNDITDTGSCSVDVVSGCAHTPGFWKTHPETWDSLGDYTTAFGGTGTTAGEVGFAAFITTTPFPYTTGSFTGATYLDILNGSGGR